MLFVSKVVESLIDALVEPVVLVDLLELAGESLFGLLRRELDLKLRDGLSDLLLVASIVSQGDAEQLAHVPQHLDVEVVVFELAAGRPKVRDLESEAVDELEVLPHHHSTSALLLLLDCEVAAVEVEHIGVLREKKREDPFLQSVSPLVRAAVHKQVLASGVAVDVAVEQDVSRLQGLPHHHLGGAVLGTLLHARRNPLPIQVEARKRRSVVAHDDSVWIQHRDDLEHEVVSQVLGIVVVGNQELQYSLYYVRGVAFSRVDSRRDDNRPSNCNILRSRTEIGNDRHLTVVVSNGLANDGLPDSVLALWSAKPG